MFLSHAKLRLITFVNEVLIDFINLVIHFFDYKLIINKRQLKETHNSYFCVTPKNQALHECALFFFK